MTELKNPTDLDIREWLYRIVLGEQMDGTFRAPNYRERLHAANLLLTHFPPTNTERDHCARCEAQKIVDESTKGE